MYGLTPFGGTGFGLWDAFNDFDKYFFGGSMPMSSCKTDIRDDGDKYVLESELPGFEKEDIKLDLSGTQLTITGLAQYLAAADDRGVAADNNAVGVFLRSRLCFQHRKVLRSRCGLYLLWESLVAVR